METSAFYDLRRLFSLRDMLEGLDPDAPPGALLVESKLDSSLKRIGVLSGAFDPPTNAHVELGARARESFQLDRVLFLVSRITIDKEKNEGLSLEDRLLLLSLLAQDLAWASAATTNRGLYFEQAAALRSLAGAKAKIFFIVGMDKVAQILDARYYHNRNDALLKLFIEAQLIAASRERAGDGELRELLAREGDDNYADRIYFLPMPEETKALAASSVRAQLVRGENPASYIPQIVNQFLSATDAYRAGYEVRRRLVDKLFAMREWAEERADLRYLTALAREATENGRTLRSLLEAPAQSVAGLKEFLSTLGR